MKILAVGATGKFAHLVVPELKKRGLTVRALIRDRKSESKARQLGADEAVVGVLEDAPSLRAAAEGVEGVFHIGPAFAPGESQMGVNMVEASRASGVRRFVYSAVLHPSLPMTNHQAKLPVQAALYHSGMNFTVLQPAMFMQNLEQPWSQVVETRRFALPSNAQLKACYVDYRDVAESAAIAFATDRLDYGVFELCSPGMLSRAEVAALMSQAAGFTIEATQIAFDAWADQGKLPPGPFREGLRRMYDEYDQHGFPGGNALALRTILEREPRTLEQYLNELAQRQTSRAA